MYYQNRLSDLLWQLQQQQMQQQYQPNMLAQAQDFDPNSIVGQMLAAQRRADAIAAQRAAQPAQQAPQKPQGRLEGADEVLRRRMRQAGLE